MSTFSPSQIVALQVIETLCSAVSIVSCIYMEVHIYGVRKSKGLIDRLLAVLLFIDLVLSFNYAVGVAGTFNHGYCMFQGFINQWFSLAGILWSASMAFQVYKFIVHKKHPNRIRRKLKRYALSIMIVSFLISIILLGAGVYGNADIWCWISNDYQYLRYLCFYSVLFICWLFVGVCYGLTSFSMRIQNEPRNYDGSSPASVGSSSDATGGQSGGEVDNYMGGFESAEMIILHKVRQYTTVYIVTWFFSFLNRTAEYIYGKPVFVTSILEVISLPLQGFLNCACYAGVFDLSTDSFVKDETTRSSNSKVIQGADNGGNNPASSDSQSRTNSSASSASGHDSRNSQLELATTVSPMVRATHRDSSVLLPAIEYKPKEFTVFATTFNIGEAPLSEMSGNIKDWILKGHDIYAIGVQECIDLKGLREMMLDYLGGPDAYRMFTVEIGSNRTNLGYHGYIALTCFARTEDILQGHVKLVDSVSRTMATGTNLIVTTAENKGAVGLLFQVHDTSIGFVTAHLPSDSKGKSKLPKRNASIGSILKEIVLAPEDSGFDMQLQHDHIVIMGDLNYRMDTARTAKEGVGASILTNVATAGSIEKSMLGDDPYWVSRKYNLLRSKSDPLYATPEESAVLQMAREAATLAWESVLQTDELRLIMKYGGVFSGFMEPLPCFPPSYKRKKGREEGDCGDYTDALEILRGFTNTGEVDVESAHIDPNLSAAVKSIATIARQNISSIEEGNEDEEDEDKGNAATPKDESTRDSSAEQAEVVESFRPSSSNDESINSSSSLSEASFTPPSMRRRTPASAKKLGAKRRQSTLVAIAPTNAKETKKFRPPSFTDRILYHSLPDQAHRLTLQGYDFCDDMRCSDHRPVSMALRLEVLNEK